MRRDFASPAQPRARPPAGPQGAVAPSAGGERAIMTGTLLSGFLALMVTGIPVAIAMAGASLIYFYVSGNLAADGGRAPDDQRHRQFSAARGAVLHPCRQPDEQRRHHQPHLQLRAGAGRLDEGRPGTRQHHRVGDLRRHVGHGHRRCRGPRHHRDQGDARSRLLEGILGRRHGSIRDARPDHSAVAAVRDLRHGGQRLDRPAVPGGHPAGPGDDGADDAHGRRTTRTRTTGAPTSSSCGAASARPWSSWRS